MTETDHTPHDALRGARAAEDARDSAAEARLAALIRDLETLQGYLEERGRHTYDLAQRFLENARRDTASRAYDERQATMLEYQHYIWHEIAGRMNQLILAYGAPGAEDEQEHEQDTGDTTPPTPGEA